MEGTDIKLHVVAAFAWIKRGDHYLLGRRSNDDPQAGGMWALIGGKIDNEVGFQVIEDALIREILEETGVTVSKDMRYLTNQAFIRSSGHHVVSLIFKTDWVSGEAQALDGQEEVRWMTVEEIEELIANNPQIGYLRNSFELVKES